MGIGVTEREVHAANFAALEKARPNVPLRELRKKALDRFLDMGYPSTRQEEWRTTNVAGLSSVPFALASLTTSRPSVGVDGQLIGGLPGFRLTFVNGRFERELSQLAGLPEGVRATTLAEALEDDRPLVEKHLARHAPYRDHAFTALNTAFMEEGVVVHVDRGVVLPEIVHALFVTASGEEPLVAHPRVLVVAEEHSQVTVVETHAGSGRYLGNGVTEISLAPSSVVRHVRIQREGLEATHVGSVHVHQERASTFTSHAIAFGAGLSRTDASVQLAGEGAECRLFGLYVGHGTQHLDNHTFVDHATPHGTSQQLYKGVLAGRSRGVFHGRILVRKDAQKTDARQGSHSLVLSDEALADTKPQLEIHADDVKCSHGATIGQLDDDAVFYMRARGLSAAAARALLTHAFAEGALEALAPPALRAEVERALAGYLPEAAAAELEP